jgi:hypothetical protein
MAWRPHPKKARTNPRNPAGWATCQRSGFVGNAKDLRMNMEWRGLKVMPTGILAYGEVTGHCHKVEELAQAEVLEIGADFHSPVLSFVFERSFANSPICWHCCGNW